VAPSGSGKSTKYASVVALRGVTSDLPSCAAPQPVWRESVGLTGR
jgi:hypothetical protein